MNMLREANNCLPLEDIGTLPEDQESPVDEQNSPIDEEHHSPAIECTPLTRPTQKRKEKFNDKEDALLVSAWLNINTNPVLGTNQTHSRFWKRVYDYYYSSKEFESERSRNSLMRQWNYILENMNKFCECVSWQHGVTIQDKLMQATALFKAEDTKNKSFAFMHCWNLLREQPKWHEKLKELVAKKQVGNKKRKATKDVTSGTSTLINVDGSSNGNIENESPDADIRKRSMCKKKDKQALQRGGGDACLEALDHLWEKKKESNARKERKKEERYNQLYALEKERLD